MQIPLENLKKIFDINFEFRSIYLVYNICEKNCIKHFSNTFAWIFRCHCDISELNVLVFEDLPIRTWRVLGGGEGDNKFLLFLKKFFKVVWENSIPRKSAIMSDLSDAQRFMLIGARFVEASVYRTTNLVFFSTITMSRLMTAYTKLQMVSHAKQNSGRKSKLSDRNRHTFKRIVTQKRKTTQL